MNHLENLTELKNRYFGMRHGEAENNAQGIIVSDPTVGAKHFGLTENGRKMVLNSVKKSNLSSDVVIVSSDFLRARQTAEIVQKTLGSGRVILDPRLRERFFGDYENKPLEHYLEIWQADQKNPDSTQHGVESAEHQMERVTAVVAELEQKYSGKNILLVSHGDPLQFLETAFAKIPVSEHQKYPLFDLAEIKELKLSK